MKEVTLKAMNASCYCFFGIQKHSHCRRCDKFLWIGNKVMRSSASRPVIINGNRDGYYPYLCHECLESLQH